MTQPKAYILLDAVTETKTSEPIPLDGARRVTFMFKRANHSSGSSAFKVQVSIDGENWIDFNKLIDNVTNTNAQMLTRVGTVTLSSNTEKVYAMDLEHDIFKFARAVVTETTDGTHTAKAFVDYQI